MTKITIPQPIPVPIITREGDTVKIDRSQTETAKNSSSLGAIYMIETDNLICICCACKTPIYNAKGLSATVKGSYNPPLGFRWGGWFCGYCLGQGKLAHSLGLVIDQLTCEIEQEKIFDKGLNIHHPEVK